jgi:hypothetical protein
MEPVLDRINVNVQMILLVHYVKLVGLKSFWIYTLIQIVINLILLLFIESVELCSNNDATKGESLLSITFGSGSAQYSNETPSSFNFSTTHQQKGDVSTYYISVPKNFNLILLSR